MACLRGRRRLGPCARLLVGALLITVAVLVGGASPAGAASLEVTSSYGYDLQVATATAPANAPSRAWRIYDESIGPARESADVGLGSRAAEGIPDFIGPVRESSDAIANGHAFAKHVVEGGEFPGVSNPDQLARIVERARTYGDSRALSNGRTAFYDGRDNTLVIRNPNSADGGTVFRPTDGRDYFNGLQ